MLIILIFFFVLKTSCRAVPGDTALAVSQREKELEVFSAPLVTPRGKETRVERLAPTWTCRTLRRALRHRGARHTSRRALTPALSIYTLLENTYNLTEDVRQAKDNVFNSYCQVQPRWAESERCKRVTALSYSQFKTTSFPIGPRLQIVPWLS